MDIQKIFPTTKTSNLFYSKPYIRCEECLKTPLKCKKCLFEFVKRMKNTQNGIISQFKTTKTNLDYNPEILVRKPRHPFSKFSLNDAVGITAKALKPKETQKIFFEKDENKYKNKEFLPKLPQKIFNHKYLVLPEGKRKVLPNMGTGTEIFIKLKEKRNGNAKKIMKSKRNEKEDLFYRKEYIYLIIFFFSKLK